MQECKSELLSGQKLNYQFFLTCGDLLLLHGAATAELLTQSSVLPAFSSDHLSAWADEVCCWARSVTSCVLVSAAQPPCLKRRWRSCTGAPRYWNVQRLQWQQRWTISCENFILCVVCRCRRASSRWAAAPVARGSWGWPSGAGLTMASSRSSRPPPGAGPRWATSSWRLEGHLCWEWPSVMSEESWTPVLIQSESRLSHQVREKFVNGLMGMFDVQFVHLENIKEAKLVTYFTSYFFIFIGWNRLHKMSHQLDTCNFHIKMLKGIFMKLKQIYIII